MRGHLRFQRAQQPLSSPRSRALEPGARQVSSPGILARPGETVLGRAVAVPTLLAGPITPWIFLAAGAPGPPVAPARSGPRRRSVAGRSAAGWRASKALLRFAIACLKRARFPAYHARWGRLPTAFAICTVRPVQTRSPGSPRRCSDSPRRWGRFGIRNGQCGGRIAPTGIGRRRSPATAAERSYGAPGAIILNTRPARWKHRDRSASASACSGYTCAPELRPGNRRISVPAGQSGVRELDMMARTRSDPFTGIHRRAWFSPLQFGNSQSGQVITSEIKTNATVGWCRCSRDRTTTSSCGGWVAANDVTVTLHGRDGPVGAATSSRGGPRAVRSRAGLGTSPGRA